MSSGGIKHIQECLTARANDHVAEHSTTQATKCGAHKQSCPTALRPVAGRDISALLNPRPVVLIGAHAGGITDFASCAWVTPISHTPSLVAFALRESSYTLSLLRKSGCFSICTVDSTQQEVVKYCGNHSGYSEHKGDQVAHHLIAVANAPRSFDNECVASSQTPRVPIFNDALSMLVGTVLSCTQAGDHLLVTAEMSEAATRCTTDERGRIDASATLLCVQHDSFTSALFKSTAG